MERSLRNRWIFVVFFLSLTVGELPETQSYGSYNDVCGKNPCYHGGQCVQTSIYPGYKCQCFGTGYHGGRCQHNCPQSLVNSVNKRQTSFPNECIVI